MTLFGCRSCWSAARWILSKERVRSRGWKRKGRDVECSSEEGAGKVDKEYRKGASERASKQASNNNNNKAVDYPPSWLKCSE